MTDVNINTSIDKSRLIIGEGRFLVKISDDELEAWLEPLEEGVSLHPTEYPKIKEELIRLGLHGVLDEPLYKLNRIIVAQGKHPRKGADGRIEYLIDLSSGPKEISPYRIDWREVNRIISVPKGTIIAKVFPPEPGEPGITVWGRVIPAIPGKEISIKCSSGLKFDRDKGIIIAEESGCLRFERNRLTLDPYYTLEGDVDWNTGNINFFGKKLIIKGSIKRGFKITAEGDVEIHKNVENDTFIKVKGNLTILGLICGENIRIEVEGNATLKTVEYAKLRIKGNLTILDYLLQVKALIAGMLTVLSEKGSIIGGELFIEGSAQVNTLGNEAFIPTHIRVGYSYRIAEQIENLKEELDKLDEITDKLKALLLKGIQLAKKGSLKKEQKQILYKVHKSLREKIEEMAEIQEKIKELQEQFETNIIHTLQVFKEVYPNVKVGIGKYEKIIKKKLSAGMFLLQGKKIIFRHFST